MNFFIAFRIIDSIDLPVRQALIVVIKWYQIHLFKTHFLGKSLRRLDKVFEDL